MYHVTEWIVFVSAIISVARSSNWAKFAIQPTVSGKGVYHGGSISLTVDHCQAIKVGNSMFNLAESIQLHCLPSMSGGTPQILATLFSDESCSTKIQHVMMSVDGDKTLNISNYRLSLLDMSCSSTSVSGVSLKVADACSSSSSTMYMDVQFPDDHCMSPKDVMSPPSQSSDNAWMNVRCCKSDQSLLYTNYSSQSDCEADQNGTPMRLSSSSNGQCFSYDSNNVRYEWQCSSFVDCDSQNIPIFDPSTMASTCQVHDCLGQSNNNNNNNNNGGTGGGLRPPRGNTSVPHPPHLPPRKKNETTDHGHNGPWINPTGDGHLPIDITGLEDMLASKFPDQTPGKIALEMHWLSRRLSQIKCDPDTDEACGIAWEVASNCDWESSGTHWSWVSEQNRCMNLGKLEDRMPQDDMNNIDTDDMEEIEEVEDEVQSINIRCCASDHSLLFSSFADNECKQVSKQIRLARDVNGHCFPIEAKKFSESLLLSWRCTSFQKDCRNVPVVTSSMLSTSTCSAECVEGKTAMFGDHGGSGIDDEEGMSKGAMLTIIGCAVLVIILIIVGLVIYRRKRLMQSSDEMNMNSGYNGGKKEAFILQSNSIDIAMPQ